MKDVDPWIDGSAAGAAAGAAARAAAGAAAGAAATVCTYCVMIGGARIYLDDKVHTVAAEAAAPAAAPAADPWIHGSISFIMNHILYYGMKSNPHSHTSRRGSALR